MWHERLSFITCKKWLVRGNHDKKSLTWYTEHGWDMVCESFCLVAFGKKILFSHIPIKDDGWYDINIHGHFHDFSIEKVKEFEPEVFKIMSSKHHLISLEALHYEPIKLQRIIEQY
jgi:calcineurin-like phosphoesterase family protein